ncbi:MAG: hypothetical protein ACFFCM_15680 [Promethearchaeota archaeon]
MKLVIQTRDSTEIKLIKEHELVKVIENIKKKYNGREIEPLKYELFRYKLSNGIIIITKDNKILRTKNEWYEYRALSALSKKLGEFKHGVTYNINGQQLEVDGVSIDEEILVEIKRDKINQDWIDFYSKKLNLLNFKQLFLIAASYEENLNIPSSIRTIKFKADWESIKNYYATFKFPEWIKDSVPHRHFRFLLPNGKWKGAKRKFTKTPKHTPTSKFFQAIKWLKFWLPVKIYYTMSRMVNPPAEYFGRGYPMSKLLAVFDIDSDAHIHIIGSEGYCKQCIKESIKKVKLSEEILRNEGYHTKTIFSGKKGFHIYLMEEERALEITYNELEEIIEKLQGLTDSVTFKGKDNQFDVHRLIKVPCTIDATTGMIIDEGFNKLNLKDELIFL